MSQVLSTKDEIWAVASRGFETKIISVPQWGKDVRIREMTEPQVRKISAVMSGKGSRQRAIAAMDYVYAVVTWCLIDEENNRIFTNADQKELRSHAETSSFYLGLQEICGEVFMLSGLDTESEDEDQGQAAEQADQESEEGEIDEEEPQDPK